MGKSRVEALTSDKMAALIVKESPLASPIVVLPSILAVPLTSKVKLDPETPIPSELLTYPLPEESTKNLLAALESLIANLVAPELSVKPINASSIPVTGI